MVAWSGSASQVASFGNEALSCLIADYISLNTCQYQQHDLSVIVYIDSLWVLHTPHSNTQSSCDSEKLPG